MKSQVDGVKVFSLKGMNSVFFWVQVKLPDCTPHWASLEKLGVDLHTTMVSGNRPVNVKGRLKALLGGGMDKANEKHEMGIRNSKVGEPR